jgi:hypothetical protein
VSPKSTESVPDTVQLPASRVPVVLMPPEDETTSPQGSEVVTKLTGPAWPLVASWSVKSAECVVVVVPVIGASWTRATAVIVRV